MASVLDQHQLDHAAPHAAALAATRWIVCGAAVAFAIPFVFATTFELPRDVYYGAYGVTLALFLWAYVRATRYPVATALQRNWRAGVALGILGAAAMAIFAFRASSGSSHPHGATFVLAILWRGVFYGALDGLLLSVFPILAVFHAFRHSSRVERRRGRVEVGMLALAVSLAFTAVYHLGYPDFRSSKLAKPVAGDVIWSAPTLLTLSPLGAPIAHIGLHITAVVHDYDTTLFLPPHAGHTSSGTP